MLSQTEENYIKAIYHLSHKGQENVSTNSIADSMSTSAASVTDMIKKLALKEMVFYKKYQGVRITEAGRKTALILIRKHRLWETFLVTKLKFNWDEVHEVAEEMEHIKSPILISRLDEYLGKPKVDPHGDPIPNEAGELPVMEKLPLNKWQEDKTGTISGVKDDSSLFLQYLDRIGIQIGSSILIKERVDFDGSLEVLIDESNQLFISRDVAENLLVS